MTAIRAGYARLLALAFAPGQRARAAALCVAIVVVVVGSAGVAQPSRSAGAPARIKLVARDEAVRDVLLRLGALSHLNITVGDEVHGTVNLSLNEVTPAEALHAVCTQVRLRCVKDGRTVLVSAQSTAVVPLTVVPAARAARVVRGLFPRLAVTEGGAGNTLVLAGSEADIGAARAIVQGLDVRDPRRPTTEALSLRTQSAALVADRLRALYPGARITVVSRSSMLVSAVPSDMTQIKAAIAGIDASAPQATVAPVSSDAVTVMQRRPGDVARAVSAQLPHVRVAVSGPTVTLSGPPEDVIRAKSLIAQLDVPSSAARFTQIYRLKNVDAQSVAALIRKAFAQAEIAVDAALNAISVTATPVDQQRIAAGIAQVDGTASGSTRGGGGEEGGNAGGGALPSSHQIVQLRSIVPGAQGSGYGTSAQDIASAVQQALQQPHPELRVTAPNGLQSLILTGSAQGIRDAKELIEALDVIPQSVVLDTEILELDENSSRNIGLQLGTTSIGTTFSEVAPTPGPNGNPGRLIGFQALTRTGIAFQAQLNLLMQNGKARVLADPRITTLSGRTATIRAGDTISILTTLGGGTGTVATTQLQSFQTGVTLDITPIITSAGELSVALHPIVNSLTGYLNGVPQISTRDTQTTVHLRDNETLVIGGLIQENTQRTDSKVPVLGDIPLLGKIFRNTNTTNTRNELIIVVTPHVLGIETTTVPNAALPPGMVVPTPRPLPTVNPSLAFPVVAPPTVRPQLAPSTPPPKPGGTPLPSAAPGGSPAPGASAVPLATPSAFAQANTFVFGAPPANTYAGPGDAPQIFYVTLAPTIFTPTATVRVNAITTTNVQRLVIGTGTNLDQPLTGRPRHLARRVRGQRARAAADRDVAEPQADRFAQRRPEREHSDLGLDHALGRQRAGPLATLSARGPSYWAAMSGSSRRWPGRKPAAAAPPAANSITKRPAPARRATRSSGVCGLVAGTAAAMLETVPSARTNTMSRGAIVSFIQNSCDRSPGSGKANSMPSPGGTAATRISPCSRRASVSASASRSARLGASTTRARQKDRSSGTTWHHSAAAGAAASGAAVAAAATAAGVAPAVAAACCSGREQAGASNPSARRLPAASRCMKATVTTARPGVPAEPATLPLGSDRSAV